MESRRELELQVLSEYAKLANNMQTVSAKVLELAQSPASDVMDDLRSVERKTNLVFTLFKSAVWAILEDLDAAAVEDSEEQKD